MFKVNNRNTRTRCEICSKLRKKTPEQRQRLIPELKQFLIVTIGPFVNIDKAKTPVNPTYFKNSESLSFNQLSNRCITAELRFYLTCFYKIEMEANVQFIRYLLAVRRRNLTRKLLCKVFQVHVIYLRDGWKKGVVKKLIRWNIIGPSWRFNAKSNFTCICFWWTYFFVIVTSVTLHTIIFVLAVWHFVYKEKIAKV